MAKEFFKKVALGVAISLTSVAVLAGFTRLGNWLRPEDEVKNCSHVGSVKISGVAPTCTEPGLTDGIICGTCHGVVKPQEVIEPLGHVISIIPGYSSTCTEPGISDGQYCDRCESVVVEQQELPLSNDHDINADFVCNICGKRDTSFFTEVAVTAGEKVAGNWYRMYRSSSINLIIVDEITFIAYDQSQFYDNFIFMSGPLAYADGLEVVITDEYIDIYFVEGTYTVIDRTSERVDTLTITADTTMSFVDSSAVYRLIPPTETAL